MASPNLQLRRERKLRGWSQADVARHIDVQDYYVSRWERGEVLPSPYYQQRLCELFSKTAEELGFLQPASKEDPPLPLPVRNSEGMNPFTYGNPISEPDRFFGRTLIVEQIFSRLRNAEFESSSLVGERRIGKTSLLKYVAHPYVRQHYGLDPNRYIFIYIDLQIVDESTTPIRLWQRLLRQMANSFADPQMKHQLEDLYMTQVIDNFALEDIFDSIDAQKQYVVLLLDEFEHVTENLNFNAAFFYGLRSLAIHHHLALVTSSRSELIELCHSQAIRSSPFFNIFATMVLGLLTMEETSDLVIHSLRGTGVAFTPSEMEYLFTLAGHHPYFLQMACSFLFDAYTKGLAPAERIAYLHSSAREGAAPHLAFYWQSCDYQEKRVLTILMLREGQRRSHATLSTLDVSWAGRTIERLKHRGLVIPVGDTFALFNALFAEWIWSELTDTRSNQQSYEQWLRTDQQASAQLKQYPEASRKELEDVLSQMNAAYRTLWLHWLAEPKMLSLVLPLLKKFLISGWGVPV